LGFNTEKSIIHFFSHNFVENKISSGGAIYFTISLYIKNSVMRYNVANGSSLSHGGAISAAADTAQTVTVIQSTISNNTAIFGGGIYSGSSLLVTEDSVFSQNTAHAGGGVYVGYNGESLITNSTFLNNAVSLYGRDKASVGINVIIILNYNYTRANLSFPIIAYITDKFNNTVYYPNLYVTIESSDLLFTSGVPNNKAFVSSTGLFTYASAIMRTANSTQWIVISAPSLVNSPYANVSIYVS